MNEILLNFSYTYEKIIKLAPHNFHQSLQSIKIQLELIYSQLQEDETLDKFVLFEWATTCFQSMKSCGLEDCALLSEVNGVFLDIFELIDSYADSILEPQSMLCIANEYGDIITHEDSFFEFMGNSTQNVVNFSELIDVYLGPKITNANMTTTIYKGNYDWWKEQQNSKCITQNLEESFLKFQVQVTSGNFEFTDLHQKTSFLYYHPCYDLSHHMIKKFLILQFVRLPFTPTKELDDYVKSEKFKEKVQKIPFYE